MSQAFLAGIGKAVITPELGLPLVGYFNPRPNTGKIDDLFAKAVAFQKDETRFVLVSCDLCFTTKEIVDAVRHQLYELDLIEWADHLLLCATHTHTGPYSGAMFGCEPDAKYLAFLARQIVSAIQDAIKDLSEAKLELAQSFRNPYAFNRRYWMKDGSVVTNPGKRNPEIDRPEGPVDNEIGLLAVRKAGKLVAAISNIINHTDTLGGNLVCADWPGFMERKFQALENNNCMVIATIGCSGNINHFDVNSATDQTNSDEPRRIGEGYAEILHDMVKTLKPLEFEAICVKRSVVGISYQNISPEALAEAKAIMKRTEGISSSKDLTSEDLANGADVVARFFAGETIEYAKSCSGKTREFDHLAITFDQKFAIASLPGECFTEIGLAIKAGSPAEQTFVTELSMGECGYVCMPGCYTRGGYEILPTVGGAPHQRTAPKLVKAALELLWQK